MIIGIDPGKNIGLAFVAEDGALLEHQIISLAQLGSLAFPEAILIVGDGTGTKLIQNVLHKRGLSFEVRDETGTSLEARAFYFRDHPPKGLSRFLPKGLWSPPCPIDDYAAYALVLRYLNSKLKIQD